MNLLEAANWQTVLIQKAGNVYLTEICYLEMLKLLGKKERRHSQLYEFFIDFLVTFGTLGMKSPVGLTIYMEF